MLSSTGLCDGPIPRPEESCLVCVYVTEFDQVQQKTSTHTNQE